MSTTFLLRVTPKEAIELDRYFGEVPAEVAKALTAAGQSVKAGLSGRRGGPWRLQFQLSGPDRVEDAQQLRRNCGALATRLKSTSRPSARAAATSGKCR